MSLKQKDGGSAFPIPHYSSHSGMTLRQWYAGQALSGLTHLPTSNENIAALAFRYADLMLEFERQEEKDRVKAGK